VSVELSHLRVLWGRFIIRHESKNKKKKRKKNKCGGEAARGVSNRSLIQAVTGTGAASLRTRTKKRKRRGVVGDPSKK
jgi:hypothetical protein